MLGFAPEASAPVASIDQNDVIILSSQALTLTLSSAALSAGVSATLDAQSLITTQNSLTLQAAANFALNSQNLSATLDSVTAQITSSATVYLLGQSLVATVSGAVSLGGDNFSVAALPICAIPYPDPILEYTEVQLGNTIPLSSVALATTQNSLTLQATANFALNSQNLSASLNPVTAQVTANAVVNLTGVALTAVVSGAGSIGGDNFSVAALPICAIPYPDPILEYTEVQLGSTVPLSSLALATTLNNVAVYDDDFIYVQTQLLTLTQNSLTTAVGVSVELGSQTLSLTQNSVALSTDVTLALGSQSLTTTLNNVAVYDDDFIHVQTQLLTLTQNSLTTAAGSIVELGSQTLSLTQNSIGLGAIVALGSQSLTATQNSLTLQATANAALDPQNLSASLNSVAVQTTASITVNLTGVALTAVVSGAVSLGGDNCAVAALPVCAIPYPDPILEYTEVQLGSTVPLSSLALATTLNNVAVYEGDFILVQAQLLTLAQNSIVAAGGTGATLGSQNLALAQGAVAVTTNQVLTLGALQLLTTLNAVPVTTDQVLSLDSLNLYTTLNGFRLWQQIDTAQPFSCSGEPPGTWTDIAFGDLIYGDNFAVAATPLCSIVLCPPIRKTPAQVWGNVNTTTNTSWNKIWT